MSNSVWFEEIDRALIELLTNTIKIPNRNGELVSVPVSMRRPDPDFKIEVYPSITIYNVFSRYNSFRQGEAFSIKERDFENSKVILEKGAVPMDLYYQFDLWSKTMEDANNMTLAWYAHYDRYFNLDVIDKSGVPRSCLALRSDILRKYDYVSGDNRTFHSTVKYKIQTEIDENITTEKPMVTTIDISSRCDINITKEGLQNGNS